MARNLILIRHANVMGQQRGRYLGRTDVPLSESGIAQARSLAPLLSPLKESTSVWVSPMLRCRQTVEAIRPSTPIQIVPELREIDFGLWEEQSFQEIAQSHANEVEAWAKFAPDFCFPEGESLKSFIGRCVDLRSRIVRAEENTVVCVTHGGVISTLICLFLGLEPSCYLAFHIERASLTRLTVFENGLGRLTRLNEAGPVEREALTEWPA